MVIGRSRTAATVGVLIGSVAAALVACGVESVDSGSTGGVDDSSTGGEGGAGGADDGGARTCPAGITVLLSDYTATQIALSSIEGETRSASFLSTASTETAGLAFALSGDVALPSSAPPSGQIVLLDRFGTNVITWADPKTGEVLRQLPVGTGFESNPQDYLEVGSGRAFVTRHSPNADAGAEEFDGGSDVLVIDTEEPAIVGRIPLPPAGDIPARPARMVRLGDEVIVSLARVAADWTSTAEAELVGLSIEDEEIAWRHTLTGLKSCGRPTLSPDGSRFAVACSGAMNTDGEIDALDQSALVLFDAKKRPLREVARYTAEDIAGEPIQGRVAFASEELVLLSTHTAYGGSTHNRWLAYDLEQGTTTELLEAPPDDQGEGRGLVFTSTTCFPGCSDVCLMADGANAVLQRVRIDDDGSLELLEPIQVETKVGMPPRGIGLR
ncbi:MAG: hypothetical protein GX607_19520 [Myxococcales bacterium]|jgi:hypothetical protein|nr:hypothetical protein [Myxococcales bacterium]